MTPSVPLCLTTLKESLKGLPQESQGEVAKPYFQPPSVLR